MGPARVVRLEALDGNEGAERHAQANALEELSPFGAPSSELSREMAGHGTDRGAERRPRGEVPGDAVSASRSLLRDGEDGPRHVSGIDATTIEQQTVSDRCSAVVQDPANVARRAFVRDYLSSEVC